MEDLFRTIFEAFPKKSSIVFTGKCSDCECAITIEIFPTSEGFGLMGGALVECSTEKFVPKCAVCYKANGNLIEQYTPNPGKSTLLHKKDLLNAILANHMGMWKSA